MQTAPDCFRFLSMIVPNLLFASPLLAKIARNRRNIVRELLRFSRFPSPSSGIRQEIVRIPSLATFFPLGFDRRTLETPPTSAHFRVFFTESLANSPIPSDFPLGKRYKLRAKSAKIAPATSSIPLSHHPQASLS